MAVVTARAAWLQLRSSVAFRRWLVERCGQVVGMTHHRYCCPLARFLGGGVMVERRYVEGYDGALWRLALPEWAARLVAALDGWSEQMEPIRAEEVLSLLNAVEAEGRICDGDAC